MRSRWRGLELPSRVVRDDAVSTDSYGRFIIEPFERGFGTTIGNALRRVLLSSLEGAAVTNVKIDKVAHEFMSISGVLEDVTDILLNMKGIVLRMEGEGPKTLTFERKQAGDVRAADAVHDASIQIVNPDHKIATLTADGAFKAELVVRSGRGYATASENRTPDLELGVIPIDSIYSPVLRVRYRTEDMRVGQRTNYDRLILEVWTNGTTAPENALVEAGLILRKYLNPFVMYTELDGQTVSRMRVSAEQTVTTDGAMEELLNKPISILNLSVRAANCLESAKITTLKQLVSCTGDELQRIRSFGKTSLQEVERKLTEIGLTLGAAGELGAGSGFAAPGGALGAVRDSGPFGGPAEGPGARLGVHAGGSQGAESPLEVFTMPD